MSQWKSFLVVALFLVGLTPTATSQAAVAYSISFTDGLVNIDVRPNTGSYYSTVENNEESRFEFSANLKDNETITYTNDTDVTNNQRILSLTIDVWWSIENWTYANNFSMNAFGLSKSSSEQSDSMALTWYVNENLTGRSFASGMAENESDFESAFFRTAPSLLMSFSFTDGNISLNFSEVSFEVTTKIVTWEFTDIGNGGVGCTEMVVSNEGQAAIDVDVSISGGGVTISPGAVSVTLGSGGSITVPICVFATTQSSYKNVQVTAIAQGRESNTQLNQVNKNAGFAVIIEQYAQYFVQAYSATSDICLGQESNVYFTVINRGNYQDTVAVEIINQKDLEDAGFMVALAARQYLIDSQAEQPVQILVNASEKHNNSILHFQAITTLQGETAASSNSTILNVIECEVEEITDDNHTETMSGTPTALAGDDIGVKPGDTVQFNGAGTDEDGFIVLYEWDFNGDGVYEWSSEENGRTTNIYNNAGTYTPTLRITDNEGNTATDSLTVTVKSPEEEESRLPSLSLLAVLTMLGIVSILRRR